jgi:hypothetical protein
LLAEALLVGSLDVVFVFELALLLAPLAAVFGPDPFFLLLSWFAKIAMSLLLIVVKCTWWHCRTVQYPY